MTVDGLQQSNSTNLILKGIIALKAMSEIANALYLYNDSGRYSVRDSYNADLLGIGRLSVLRPDLPTRLAEQGSDSSHHTPHSILPVYF